MDLTTLSSLRACRTLKTEVKRKFLTSPIDPLVTSCVSDAQNCGKIQISELADRPFRQFGRVGRSNCGKIQISELADRPFRHFGRVGRSKRKFFTWPSDPFVTLDVSDAQN